MSIIGIIPARYGATRFPGKPLAILEGKSIVQRVYEQAMKAATLQEVWVATDDSRIEDHVKQFGGKVIMTSPDHPSGTDRCHEALKLINASPDYVVNIQGDEPFIAPEQIDVLAAMLDGTTQLATLYKTIEDPDRIADPNVVKVVKNAQDQALYFSRAPIPFSREGSSSQHTYYQHIGIYAYRSDVLRSITNLAPGYLEQVEKLEQLRWLEAGYSIKMAHTDHQSMGIDTPGDLDRAALYLKANYSQD